MSQEQQLPVQSEGEQSLSSKVIIFTEVTEKRAQEILQGKLQSDIPIKHHPMRWYIETVLDYYQDPALKAKGISRRQTIYTSPIPYQGHAPIPSRVLLALEVDEEALYVAEADSITAMWSGDVQKVMMLRSIVGLDRSMTREEFEEKFNKAAQDEREALLARSKEHAEAYWDSVKPYKEYVQQKEPYCEPEILMTPQSKIYSIQRYS